jgi:hypothetical protein
MARQRTLLEMFLQASTRTTASVAVSDSIDHSLAHITRFAGQLRVGTRRYNPDGSYVDPQYEGYESAVCLTASTEYGSLGPYCVRAVETGPEKGALIENVWHSMKVLPRIPKTLSHVSRYNHTIAWSWDEVTNHIGQNGSDVNMSEWLTWHNALCHNKYAIRYPFSYSPAVRKSTLGVMPRALLHAYRADPANTVIHVQDLLGVADGRKDVYFHYYMSGIDTHHPDYRKVIRKLEKGAKMLWIDVDGPRQEGMSYYREMYGVPDNWIQEHSVGIDENALNIFLNDPTYSCGHVFGLVAKFMGLDHIFKPVSRD